MNSPPGWLPARAERYIIAAAVLCLIAGAILSRWVEPGVRVQSTTVAGDTPALQFVPAKDGPHPVALLAHGFSCSKENLFRYGEALALAGFVCFSVDLSGHGASRQSFSQRKTVENLASVARELGTIDVFVGHSMGAGAGAWVVREKSLRPRLFIAVGANPAFGESSPPLLLLSGRFDEFVSATVLRARTDGRVIISPWSDHVLELFDSYLVNAAAEAACLAIGKTSTAAPTIWLWRLAGAALGALGALALMIYLPALPSRCAWARGPLVSIIPIAALALTTSTMFGAAPVFRRIPLQIVLMIALWLAVRGAGKLRLPRWGIPCFLTAVAIGCAIMGAKLTAIFVFLAALVLFAGTGVATIAVRRGSQGDGNLALTIFAGYGIGQAMPMPF